MLNQNIKYIYKTKKEYLSFFFYSIWGVVALSPLGMAGLFDGNFPIKIFFLLLAVLFAISFYNIYIQLTYKEQEITQEASVVSYEFKSPITMHLTGDEKVSVRIQFDKNSISVPMTKKEYDALNISQNDNTVIVTGLVKITDKHKFCPFILFQDFITIKDIKKADINVEKSKFV